MNTYLPQRLLLLFIAFLSKCSNVAFAALSQSDEEKYLSNFDSMQAASYAVADGDLPIDMDVCKTNQSPPTREVTVQASTNGVIDSSSITNQCGNDSICIIPIGTTLQVDTSLNLGALIVRGTVEWNDITQVHPSAFLCAGYVAVEGQGKWDMDLQVSDAFIYIKDNGAVHHHLRSRAFGSFASTASDCPTIDIMGREMLRTWSLLSTPIQSGDDKITLMHNGHLMGWRVGDRIGISPTEGRATGHGEEFTIIEIDEKGSLLLDKAAQYDHAATFVPRPPHGNVPALMSAEVVNLSRNIVITGDDFKHVGCDPNLPEAVPGEETSVSGCRCSSFRSQCTIGLHTAAMHGGSARIQNTRIERCGQRGVEGKYCLHFHKLHDCRTCLFKNNAIEGSQQRGIIIHSTHSSTVENNVLYNVRGAGIYIEDGNELYNNVKYNTVICPFPFNDDTLHGCTIPGTSNRIADTSDNQSGIFSRAATNSLSGNRVSNSFNGMLLDAGSIGRGESYDKVCESDAKLARYEGNTFHGNGRFGTYTLGFNYAKSTDQAISTDGHNIEKSLCTGFDNQGYERGVSASIVDNIDYHNAFVGHYQAGDIQYNGHHSYDSLSSLYWKETKNFQNGCSAHVTSSSYAGGNLALPDQATFLIENTLFGQGVSLEANHHCNVGTTGILCFPTYMFHNVQWKNADKSRKWMWFQWEQLQAHNANQNHGGIFTLSPPDAEHVMNGGVLEHSIFPPGFVSLVSSKFSYLLSLPGQPCVLSTEYGQLYDGGILCNVPLRALKVYSQGQFPGSASDLKVEIWYNTGGVGGNPDSSQIIGFHQIGSNGPKQGYSLPVIPSADHSYRLSLTTGNGDIPSTWVVEFGDFLVGNRFSIEYINLNLNGRLCGQNGLVSSHHDRRFLWSGDELMADGAWGNTGACAISQPPDFPEIDCSSINDGVLPATECPVLCSSTCDETTEYCDCGSATCTLKPGFTLTHQTGFTEVLDLCGAARCGEHGKCSAQYLGGELPVTSNACICDEGWSGSLCQHNPCETIGKTCSGHGTCTATSNTNAKCLCEDGFSGENCEESCDGFCVGEFPYLCARNIDGIVRYGCNQNGGCRYLRDGEEYPHDGYCTYKQASEQECLCGSDNDCKLAVSCSPDGSCPSPQYVPDSTPCNSIPFGSCSSGTCVSAGTPGEPSKKPTPAPAPTQPSTDPPSKKPTAPPVVTYCGCDSCTQYIWDTMATDTNGGSYNCGSRITWLQSSQGYSEVAACEKVSDEFPGLCGPFCNPTSCSLANFFA
mmetsp:Transcript_32276/g.67849  ORF Transcript_32276/g.67849 Transcript_32276/m.67849 type:complete len:1275 (+) Transcript_32276:77-3901(+)